MGKYTYTNYHCHKPNGQSYLGYTGRDPYTGSGGNAGRFSSHEAAGATSMTPYATYTSDNKAAAKAASKGRESGDIGGGYDGTNYFHEKANKTRGDVAPAYYAQKANTGQGGSYDTATAEPKHNR